MAVHFGVAISVLLFLPFLPGLFVQATDECLLVRVPGELSKAPVWMLLRSWFAHDAGRMSIVRMFMHVALCAQLESTTSCYFLL